jgi:hypothetical protein
MTTGRGHPGKRSFVPEIPFLSPGKLGRCVVAGHEGESPFLHIHIIEPGAPVLHLRTAIKQRSPLDGIDPSGVSDSAERKRGNNTRRLTLTPVENGHERKDRLFTLELAQQIRGTLAQALIVRLECNEEVGYSLALPGFNLVRPRF